MGYYLALAVFVIACLTGFNFMTYHNGGVKPGNWEDE